MMTATLALAAVLLAGAPAAEPAATGQPTAKTEKAKPGTNEMVCRKEAVVGSRMKERICMTQSQWDERSRQDRQDLDRSQTQKPLTF